MVPLQELQKMVISKAKYISRSIYVALYQQLTISHQLDKSYDKVYFQLLEHMYSKNIKNSLNLKQFQT